MTPCLISKKATTAAWGLLLLVVALCLVRQTSSFSLPQTTTLSEARSSSTALPCQLLGINSASPTKFSLSWPDFCERGGGTDIHADGYGLVYYEGSGLRQFHSTEPASSSPLARFIGQQPFVTCNMLSHIRYATQGGVELSNVHPFAREMWGINWSFCHNGEIPLFADFSNHWLGHVKGDRVYFPVGTTDSEAAFCALLNALRAEFTDTMPSLPVLYESIQRLCQEIVEYDSKGTIFNFLLGCGQYTMLAYSHPGKRPGSKVWNGLHYTVRGASTSLGDNDYSIDLSPKSSNKDDQVCIVATSPLNSDEEWIELKKGELILFDEGLPRVSVADLFRVELMGHGLQNDGKVLKPPRLEEDMRRYHFDPTFFAAGGI